jgi:uncharacterized protein with NRDE domain
MCLLLLARNTLPGRRWLLLANRDEFHARASAAADFWPECPDICGGRDLVAGGSWLALHRNGRFAAVTNVRTGKQAAAPRSRGALVADFVAGRESVADYTASIAAQCNWYGPFNLVVGDGGDTDFVSSVDAAPRVLTPGVHAFSNGSLDDEWPKMRHLRAGFGKLIEDGAPEDTALLDLLTDTRQPMDDDLPDTGVGLDLERTLAPIFIRGEVYGTRASTLAYARADGSLVLIERRFGPNGMAAGETRIDTHERRASARLR